MRLRPKRFIALVGACCLTFLSCGQPIQRIESVPVKEVRSDVLTVREVFRDKALRQRAVSQVMRIAEDMETVYRAALLLAVAKNAETVKHQGKSQRRTQTRQVDSLEATVSAPSSLVGVMQCIKDHESGNYAESSHTSDGSGAFQVIPGTWRTWSARAGYPGYRYAFQAPPAVQDAVVEYMLTHGGAGNWSPRYGDDPCTVGMGG